MDFNELNRESYNKIAKQFSFSRAYVWPDVLVFSELIKDGDKLLDLGCGNGRLIGLLKDKAVDYLGVDFSQELIVCAKKSFPEKSFLMRDALNLDFPEKSFDVVMCVSVLNHLPKNKHVQFVENIKKVLKPGGYLLMSNWNLWNILSKKSVWKKRHRSIETSKHRSIILDWKNVLTKWKSGENEAELYYYAFTRNEIKRLLANNGFTVGKNYYSKRGKRSWWLFGENIVTVAKLK
ncbi:MAG: class I SAM-dependent methyltransferase [Patescibacteria group bacterium]